MKRKAQTRRRKSVRGGAIGPGDGGVTPPPPVDPYVTHGAGPVTVFKYDSGKIQIALSENTITIIPESGRV